MTDLITTLIDVGLLASLYMIARPSRRPPDDIDEDDDSGGSDRTPPMTPWWPTGVEPFDREKELV